MIGIGNRKKQLLSLGVLLCLSITLPGFARLEDKRPVYPVVSTSHPFSRTLQQVLGLNALASWMAGKMVKRQLQQKFQGNLQVRVLPFSALDLAAGKVQQVNINGKDLIYDRLLPISQLHVNTVPETPVFVVLNQKRPCVIRPIKTKLQAVLTEGDLNQLFQTEKGKQQIAQTEIDLPPFGKRRIEFHAPHVQLKAGKIIFESMMNVVGAPLENAVPVYIEGNLISDNRHRSLALDDLKVVMDGNPAPLALASFVEEVFGEVADFSHFKLRGHRVEVNLETPRIEAKQLVINGEVLVAPIPRAVVEDKSTAEGLQPVGTSASETSKSEIQKKDNP